VRFGLDGSTWTYLKLACGWSILTFLTLGAAYPWMQVDLWRYQVRHTRLGSEVFNFTGNAKELLLPWLPCFVAILCNVGIMIGAAVFFTYGADVFGAEFSQTEQGILLTVVIFVANTVGAIGYLYFRVRQTRMQISGLRVGKVTFHSSLSFIRLFVFAVLSLLSMGIILSLPLALYYVLGIDIGVFPPIADPQPMTFGKAFASLILMFISFVVVLPFIWTVLFGFEVIKQMVITTTIENPEALEQAAQSASDTPRTGEGLADALDIGGF